MSSDRLNDIYDKLYQDAIEKVRSNRYELDSMIDSSMDKRFGITLIVKPDAHVTEQIQEFLTALHAIEPNQYYYPSSDIHVTFLPIIPCQENFDMDQLPLQDYIDLIRAHLSMEEQFEIHFEGITASSSCIMIQGFFKDNVLNDLRDKLRKAFAASSLHQNIDQRYVIRTAHATVVRFRKPLAAKGKFLDVLNSYRTKKFGTTTVKEIDLVFNDWYLKEKVVKTLFRFKI